MLDGCHINKRSKPNFLFLQLVQRLHFSLSPPHVEILLLMSSSWNLWKLSIIHWLFESFSVAWIYLSAWGWSSFLFFISIENICLLFHYSWVIFLETLIFIWLQQHLTVVSAAELGQCKILMKFYHSRKAKAWFFAFVFVAGKIQTHTHETLFLFWTRVSLTFQ